MSKGALWSGLDAREVVRGRWVARRWRARLRATGGVEPRPAAEQEGPAGALPAAITSRCPPPVTAKMAAQGGGAEGRGDPA